MRTFHSLQVLSMALVLGAAIGCSDDTTEDTSGAGGSTSNSMTSASGGSGGNGTGGSSGNQAPVASFTIDPTCTMSSTDPIDFTSTSTDPDGDTLTCSWVFGSGTPASSTDCNVTGVTFPNAAPYTVTLTVDDGTTTAQTSQSIAPCT